jgi:LPS export ABC transporter protein LptC
MNLNNILLIKILKKNIVLVSIIFIFLAWVNYILSDALNYNSIHNHDEKKSNHFLNDFYIEQTDSHGKISWVLKGERLEKFPNNTRSEIIEPRMKMLTTETESWRIRASHALDPDSLFKSIYLTKHVVFNKIGMDASNEVIITTTNAILYPSDEIIETDAFATIITPDSTTTGDGIIADIKNGYVKILSNAKRLSYTDSRSEQLEGDQMVYNLEKKTWAVIKKPNDDKMQIQNRVKTILKTKRITN